MQDINNVNIIGRLIKDIEINYTPSGTACGRLVVANNESRKAGDKWDEYTNFFEVTLWGKSAENLKPYLLKGKLIAVTGHLQQQRWEKDGQKNSKIVIVAENVQFCGGRNDGGNNERPQQQAPAESNGGDFVENMPF